MFSFQISSTGYVDCLVVVTRMYNCRSGSRGFDSWSSQVFGDSQEISKNLSTYRSGKGKLTVLHSLSRTNVHFVQTSTPASVMLIFPRMEQRMHQASKQQYLPSTQQQQLPRPTSPTTEDIINTVVKISIMIMVNGHSFIINITNFLFHLYIIFIERDIKKRKYT